MKRKYFFISLISSLVWISEGLDNVCWRLIVERDLTIIFSRVDEPIEADRVNEENKYWAFKSWFRKYSIQKANCWGLYVKVVELPFKPLEDLYYYSQLLPFSIYRNYLPSSSIIA
jgi:hypothetical protein